MSSPTDTVVSHYEVQKSRRDKFIDEWRNNHHTVVKAQDVELHKTKRGLSTGVYLGKDGDRPVRTVDASVHEIMSGTVSKIHRHSWDAVIFCVGGSGWTQIDGVKISWNPGDSLHLPAWAWHRHGNNGEETCRFMTFSSEPFLDTLGFAIMEDARDEPVTKLAKRPNSAPATSGNDVVSIRTRRLAYGVAEMREARLYTPWSELEFQQTPRGTRTTFLVDKAIGYKTSGLTMAIMEISPGRGQSMHRHSGEAWLYVVDGYGHSFMGDKPDQGENYYWKKGDIIAVDHYRWHQHFNDDPNRTARLLRVHILDVLLNTMNALCYPLTLLEEPPDHIRSIQAGDLNTIIWPAVTPPSWP